VQSFPTSGYKGKLSHEHSHHLNISYIEEFSLKVTCFFGYRQVFLQSNSQAQFTPRAVARIMHGIASPAYPSTTWSKTHFWYIEIVFFLFDDLNTVCAYCWVKTLHACVSIIRQTHDLWFQNF